MEEKIQFFKGLLASVTDMNFTVLDEKFNILHSETQHRGVFMSFFQLSAEYEKWNRQGIVATADLTTAKLNPVVATNSVGMAWLSDFEYEGDEIKRIYLLGPVFLDDYSVQMVERGLTALQLSVRMRRQFMEIIKELPVIPLSRFFEYGIMLHYCLTGKKISVSDFVFADSTDDAPEPVLKENHGIYMIETNVLKLIEEGNLNFKQEMDRYGVTNQGKFADKDYLRQAKNSVIILCALAARAAVKGGLAPETAYTLRDYYVQRVEDTKNLAMLNELNQEMVGDFVRRVHRTKSDSEISPPIREVCDYISLHIDGKWDIHFLASHVGYSDYYFSEKFKKETGVSVREYVMERKIERAKEYLKYGNKSIQDISDELGFSTQSHFGRVFKEKTGKSPKEYRIE